MFTNDTSPAQDYHGVCRMAFNGMRNLLTCVQVCLSSLFFYSIGSPVFRQRSIFMMILCFLVIDVKSFGLFPFFQAKHLREYLKVGMWYWTSASGQVHMLFLNTTDTWPVCGHNNFLTLFLIVTALYSAKKPCVAHELSFMSMNCIICPGDKWLFL